MFETILDEEERGQVGIGTLIVFIAMVLVAAIAAGVLINTAGFLQTQAEATGEESTSQVSDRLQIVSQSGEFNQTDSQMANLSFVVAQSPGSDNIDLSQTSVELIGADGQESFKMADEGNATIDIFTNDDLNVVLTDNSERAEINIVLYDPGAAPKQHLNYLLEEGDRLAVTFTTPSGASTTAEIRVPSTVVEESVRL